jgi:hypothetical protein
MIKHEFIAIKRSQIPNEIDFSLTHRYPCTVLPDEIIFHNMNDFKVGFKTCFNDLKSINEGLNYYGVTIILNEDINQFISVLLKHKRWRSVKTLIEFCNTAKEDELDIIHFGI